MIRHPCCICNWVIFLLQMSSCCSCQMNSLKWTLEQTQMNELKCHVLEAWFSLKIATGFGGLNLTSQCLCSGGMCCRGTGLSGTEWVERLSAMGPGTSFLCVASLLLILPGALQQSAKHTLLRMALQAGRWLPYHLLPPYWSLPCPTSYDTTGPTPPFPTLAGDRPDWSLSRLISTLLIMIED